MNWGRFLLSPKGRTSRAGYWLLIGIVIGVTVLGTALDQAFGTYDEEFESGIFEVVTSLVVAWPLLAVTIKRFHDRGLSGWWVVWFVLLTMAPILFLFALPGGENYFDASGPTIIGWLILSLAGLVQVIQFVILAILPGQSGANKYGTDPLEA